MRTFRQFFEMAVGKIVYNHPDMRALGSDKLNRKFAVVLDRLAGFRFNFVFQPIGPATARGDVMDGLAEQGVEQRGHITVVLTGGTNVVYRAGNATIMPLTPWTRIHRACHGFIGGGFGGYYNPVKQQQSSASRDMESFMARTGMERAKPDQVFCFTSAQEPHTSGIEAKIELYREILTEFIWHGGTIRRPKTFQAEVFARAYGQLEDLCRSILSGFVGQTVIEGIDFMP